MKAKRRTEIMMETYETTIIRFRHRQTTIFCESCNANTPHLSIVQAVSVLSLSESAILHLAETKQIHFLETETGELLICSNSILTENKRQ